MARSFVADTRTTVARWLPTQATEFSLNESPFNVRVTAPTDAFIGVTDQSLGGVCVTVATALPETSGLAVLVAFTSIAFSVGTAFGAV
ncbi:hypothetical protein ASC95_18090 [Pelomonas sp. Root1217]|nr:hypothetical protein ASC95_18090 [Pelomonas sp. Root1217]